jgi:hypothetical protein
MLVTACQLSTIHKGSAPIINTRQIVEATLKPNLFKPEHWQRECIAHGINIYVWHAGKKCFKTEYDRAKTLSKKREVWITTGFNPETTMKISKVNISRTSSRKHDVETLTYILKYLVGSNVSITSVDNTTHKRIPVQTINTHSFRTTTGVTMFTKCKWLFLNFRGKVKHAFRN